MDDIGTSVGGRWHRIVQNKERWEIAGDACPRVNSEGLLKEADFKKKLHISCQNISCKTYLLHCSYGCVFIYDKWYN